MTASVSVWEGEIREELSGGMVRYIRRATAAEAVRHGVTDPARGQYVARTYQDGRLVSGPTFGRTIAELSAPLVADAIRRMRDERRTQTY